MPASLYYYPPYDQFGYYPPNQSGVNNGLPLPSNNHYPPQYRPMPVYFDDNKPHIDDTTTVSSLKSIFMLK